MNTLDQDIELYGQCCGKGDTGPQGPPGVPGTKAFMQNTFSYTSSNGIGGISYISGSEILNIINKKNLPITYICIVWSSSLLVPVQIQIKDFTNVPVQTLIMNPSPVLNSKNVYEINLNPPIHTNFTRLLRFIIAQNVTIYSIMIGY